jgi:tyrosyl-tRNA synthetase
MYGKVMSLSDDVLFDYFWLVTDVPEDEIEAMKRAVAEGANPRDLKMRLAREIVTQLHSAADAEQAEAEFVRVFQQQELPEDMPEVRIAGGATVVDAIITANLARSRSEARRLVEQGGVYLDGDRVEELDAPIAFPNGSRVLRVGRRRFARLLPS